MKKPITFLSIIFISLMCLLASCTGQHTQQSEIIYNSLPDFEGKVMGTLTGAPYEDMLKSDFKDLKWRYYDDLTTTLMALERKDIDAFVLDSPVLTYIEALYPDKYGVFPELAASCEFSFILKKRGELTAPVTQIIRDLKADGSIERLKEKWFSGDPERMQIDWKKYNLEKRSNGILRYAFDPNTVPMVYIGDNSQVLGLETELVLLIADRLDKGVEFINSKIPSIFLYLTQDKADIGAACFVVTDERKENVDFCESYYIGGTALLCRIDELKGEASVYNGKNSDQVNSTIAIEVGTTNEKEARKAFPDANYMVVTDATNGFLAVKSRKAKAYAVDKTAFKAYEASGGTGLKIYRDTVLGEAGNKAIGISPKTKIPEAEKLINDFLNEMAANGTLAEMTDRWLIHHNYVMPTIKRPEQPTLKIHIATTGLSEPFTFYQGKSLSGFDIELAHRFALWCNAEVDFDSYDWPGVIAACSTGKADYVFSNLFATPEREEVIDFSNPYAFVETVLVVRDDDNSLFHAPISPFISFCDGLSDSFQKTFVRENRWQLILRGLLVTLEITLFAGILGTILGFLLCLCIRSKMKYLRIISNAFCTIMQGIPQLVVLMITFFVIFGKVQIAPDIVGIIAFSVIFSVSVAGILNTGIEAIDRGQWEAATALGFGKVGTFRRVIMPQAVRHILPLYKGEFVSMMKLTSIVGYISIEDLTKVGDIIRSRTYEAFFPLLAIAVIYFLMSAIIIWIIGRVEIRIDPKKRPRCLPYGIRKESSSEADHITDAQLPAAEGSLISIQHLKKEYPGVTPLSDVNATIKKGEVITIIGPSGTGKSTLLRCINRLENPSSGKVLVFGQDTSDKKVDLSKLRRRTGMVFQSFNLFGHLTVIENIIMAPIVLKGESPQKAYNHGMALLRTVGMAAKALSYPDELSGGQKQRVAIARTLAMNPEIILFDEPTSALDPTMVGEVLSVIRSLAKQGLTMLIVTHEMKFARDVSTRIFYMDQGIIYEDGAPEQIFDNPQRELTRQFIHRLKVLDIKIDSPEFDFIGINDLLEQFGRKNLISQRTIIRMQSVFEELCIQCLLPRMKKEVLIRFSVEYAEEKQQTDLTLRFGGEVYNPLEEGDELSILMVRGACTTIDYHTLDSVEGITNEIKMTLK